MKRARRRSPQQEIQRWRERQQKEWDDQHPRVSSGGRLLSDEDKYKRGDKTVIMKALTFHLATEDEPLPPLPDWLRWALLKALIRATVCEIDSWDDVFGPPVETETGRPARGKARLAVRRKRELVTDIYKRVEQLSAEGRPVDRTLFEEVAAEFGIGRAWTEKCYYDNRAWLKSYVIAWGKAR